jgi:hypothetical protein
LYSFKAEVKRQTGLEDQLDFTLNMINADCQIDSLLVQDAAAQIQLSKNGQVLNMPPAKAVISELRWKELQLLDNDLTLALLPDGNLMLSAWSGKFIGGDFKLAGELTTPLTGRSNATLPMSFEARKLPAGKFFSILHWDYISSDMLLSGKLNPMLDLSNNKLYFAESKLAASTPEGCLLEIKNLPPEAVRIRNKARRDFTLAVLQSIKSYKTEFTFSLIPGEAAVALKADGAPSRPVPFVYQGSQAKIPFRPAEPGEIGFYQELELNVNIKQHPEDPGL